MNQLFNSIRSFAIEEDGAQVIEYALIIAVVSIVLVIALSGINGNFSASSLGQRCLTTGTA